jgi:hypothetical protein
MAEQLLAAAVEEDVLVDAVVIPLVVRRHLVGPLRHPGLRVPREDGHRPLVVAGPLVGIPASGVSGAVVQEVQLGVVGVPSPGGAAPPPPLVALPRGDAEITPPVRRVVGVGVAGDHDLVVGARAVRAPHLGTGVGVERRHVAAHAELAARDAGDDDVPDHDRGVRHRLPPLVIGVLDPEDLLARRGVQREQVTLQQLDVELAARMIGEAAVDDVAAGDRDDVRRLVRRELPDLRRTLLRQIQREDLVRKRAVEVHHVPHHEWVAFVSAQRTRGHGPGSLEIPDVVRVDLSERAVALQVVRPARHHPLVGVPREGRQILCGGGTRDDDDGGEGHRGSRKPSNRAIHGQLRGN